MGDKFTNLTGNEDEVWIEHTAQATRYNDGQGWNDQNSVSPHQWAQELDDRYCQTGRHTHGDNVPCPLKLQARL